MTSKKFPTEWGLGCGPDKDVTVFVDNDSKSPDGERGLVEIAIDDWEGSCWVTRETARELGLALIMLAGEPPEPELPSGPLLWAPPPPTPAPGVIPEMVEALRDPSHPSSPDASSDGVIEVYEVPQFHGDPQQ